MRPLPLRPLARAALALALLALPVRADVWVVDAAGGGDFSDIQPAVGVAADGDTLLVRAGTYGGFTVANEGLHVVADTGAAVLVAGPVRIVDTLVQHEVLLAGLEIRPPNVRDEALHDALGLAFARGPVRVEACTIVGAPGDEYATVERGGDALQADFALDLSVVRSTLRGGDGAMSFTGFRANRGGDGLRAASSAVSLHNCTVTGGAGGPGDFAGCDFGGDGGHGARLTDAPAFLSGSSFQGGDGGGDDFLACRPGGDGVWLVGAASAGYTLDVASAGGLGACGAPDGVPFQVDGGATLTALPGAARAFEGVTPAREGDLVALTFRGEPGDAVYLLVSFGAERALALPLNGVRLVDLPLAQGRRFMGTVPAGGTLVKTVPLPPLPPAVDAQVLFLQSLFVDAGGGNWIASPSTLVLLDASL